MDALDTRTNTTAIEHRLSAWDGLALRALEWRGGNAGLPLLCLPGLARTASDYEGLAQTLGTDRRVVSLDYAGHGRSGRSRNAARYEPEACVRDVADICAALHLHRVIVVGTSFGGLLAMGLASTRPTLLAAVVLNDIGPEVGADGVDFVRRFLGRDPALPDLEACIAFLRKVLPPLSLDGEDEWRTMARLTYEPGRDGKWHPVWDRKIARLLDERVPDLWTRFEALADIPLMLVHGEASAVLLPETIARMRAVRPDLVLTSLPGIGHAPTLREPAVTASVRAFLRRLG